MAWSTREIAELSGTTVAFYDVAQPLRDNDRALLTIYARLFSEESMDALLRLLAANPHEALDEAFRDLPANADEATCQALAERMAPFVGTNASVTLENQGRDTPPGRGREERCGPGDDIEVGTIGELRARAHETAHVLGDLLGGLIGCRFTYRDGHWMDRCRVALLHIPIANSVGFTSRRVCTICRSDVSDCEHEPGTTYRTTAGRTPEGSCTVCGLETCDHRIGETVDAVAAFALADLVLREVSLVERPRDPLCRISGREIDEQELVRLLGRAPRPEDVLLDHRCMHQCGQQ